MSSNAESCNSINRNKFYIKANALRLENMYKEAAANYLNAILIERDNAQSYLGLGICCKHLKQYAKAIKYLNIASSLDENNYEIFFELGVCHQLEGNACGAIKNFIRAIQINPDNPHAILQLGISHELCEEYDLAMMIYNKLIENSRGFIKAYEHKSALLMKLDKYKEASTVLSEIIKLNPDYYSAYAGIGVCLEKLGEFAGARRYYRKFLTLKPLSAQSSFIKDRLEKIKNRKYPEKHLKLCR